jgi:DNA polymerase-3 subunit alpha
MSYIPIRTHTHYSLQLGLSKPSDISARCKELNIYSCGITDLANIAGSIAFYKEMTSKKIKPLLGCNLYLSFNDASTKTLENEKLSKITLISKNQKGWNDLINIVSNTNSQRFFYKKPRIDLENLKTLITSSDSLICITGYYDSLLWNDITSNNILKEDWQNVFIEHIEKLNKIFGRNNVFIEIQMFTNYFNESDIGKEIRLLSKKHQYQLLASTESYYCNSDDSSDHKILLCSNLKTTLPEISKKIISDIDTGFNQFFNGDKYYILKHDTMEEIYTQEEIENTIKISQMCEEFCPLNKPILPDFNYPTEFNSSSEYLRQLCREGWRTKIQNNIKKEYQQQYVDRIKYELEVLEGAGLSSYFLIVRDIINYVKKNNWLAGPGRGSAAGCLVSYLIGITEIDPIPYNLIFERFYNAGRNTSERISMPDIDVDVPIDKREAIIEYIKDKYGYDKVAQMITFTTLKGRGALKEVLRVYNNMSFEEMNNITKNIPEESKIADELQEIREEEGEASIIRWALENNPEKFKDWCEIDKNGQLIGPLAKRFEQAIRIEGTKFHQSKHAAGIAISARPLSEICPMIFDPKTDQFIAGLEMNDLDALGVIKFDILGIALLDKIMFINNLINKKEKKNEIFKT